VLAVYQVWFGMPSHRCAFSGEPLLPNERVYDSSSRIHLPSYPGGKGKRHQRLVVDWYGPAVVGVGNYEDRKFQDQAAALLFEKAKEEDFRSHFCMMINRKDSGVRS